MKTRPLDAKHKFYKKLKLNKEIREIIRFFHRWKKEASKEK